MQVQWYVPNASNMQKSDLKAIPKHMHIIHALKVCEHYASKINVKNVTTG